MFKLLGLIEEMVNSGCPFIIYEGRAPGNAEFPVSEAASELPERQASKFWTRT